MIDAIVLAGGVDRGEIAEETGIIHRPLLEVGGMAIIQRVLAALRGATLMSHIILVAPPPVHEIVGEEAVDKRITARDSFGENVERGVSAASPNADSVLLVTGDLPLLTANAVNDLVEQAAQLRADVVYPIIPKESIERTFPGGKRTYVRLREGVFTGGNGVVIGRAFVQERQDLIRRLFAARKNPLKLASMFGLRCVIGLLTHRLRLAELEARACEIVSGRVAAIVSAYPELGFDVDKIDDLLLARKVADTFDRVI